jgi:hypothetical protein
MAELSKRYVDEVSRLAHEILHDVQVLHYDNNPLKKRSLIELEGKWGNYRVIIQ